MAGIHWDDKYYLGFDMIDSQHREIFRLFEDVSNKLEDHNYESMINKIIEFLDEYIIYHFSQEEEFQEFIGYPNYEEHKRFHAVFIEEFSRYKKSLQGEGAPMSAIRGLNMLADWLVEHIQREDFKLVSFIRENN
jgi:hemerythrin